MLRREASSRTASSARRFPWTSDMQPRRMMHRWNTRAGIVSRHFVGRPRGSADGAGASDARARSFQGKELPDLPIAVDVARVHLFELLHEVAQRVLRGG